MKPPRTAKPRRTTALAASLLALIGALHSAAPAAVTPDQIVRRMANGINLGNTLDCPTEGSWGNGPAQQYYFDDFKAVGITAVRIPVRWGTHAGTASPYTVDSAYLSRVEQVVNWSLSRGFVTTINAHHESWLMDNYSGNIARFEKIWQQIAARFQNYSENLVFEILNEPNGLTDAQVNDVNRRILPIIRATNPTRIVKLAVNQMNSVWSLGALTPPEDPYLLAEVHYYNPWTFCGPDNAGATWGSAADLQSLSDNVATMANWSAQTGIPVVVGEYGAAIQSNYTSRKLFYRELADQLLHSGMAFTVWDDNGDFGVYHRSSRSWDQGVLNSFMVRLHEGELLTVANSSGDTHRIITGSQLSNGAAAMYDSDANGDYVTYLVKNVPAQSYNVRVGVKKYSSRGVVQMSIGRADDYAGTASNVGAPQDLYSSGEVITELDLGTWTPGTSGDKHFRFTVTGKNSASTGRSVSIDYIELYPQ